MGVDRAVHASGAPPRAAAHDGPSGGRERGAVYRDERPSVAHAASGVHLTKSLFGAFCVDSDANQIAKPLETITFVSHVKR